MWHSRVFDALMWPRRDGLHSGRELTSYTYQTLLKLIPVGKEKNIEGAGRDSSVGTATRYGLDGPGIDSRWRWEFPHPSRQALGPTQPPIRWIPGVFPGGKAAGVALTTHPHLAPGLKKQHRLVYHHVSALVSHQQSNQVDTQHAINSLHCVRNVTARRTKIF